mmetsp:Transcript_44244/g.143541  ORF Transcript_44244/g.143541 Transcript_44244/m.143541 type:complete len:226 (+) Transcript_44244:52-729(+)
MQAGGRHRRLTSAFRFGGRSHAVATGTAGAGGGGVGPPRLTRRPRDAPARPPPLGAKLLFRAARFSRRHGGRRGRRRGRRRRRVEVRLAAALRQREPARPTRSVRDSRRGDHAVHVARAARVAAVRLQGGRLRARRHLPRALLPLRHRDGADHRAHRAAAPLRAARARRGGAATRRVCPLVHGHRSAREADGGGGAHLAGPLTGRRRAARLSVPPHDAPSAAPHP